MQTLKCKNPSHRDAQEAKSELACALTEDSLVVSREWSLYQDPDKLPNSN